MYEKISDREKKNYNPHFYLMLAAKEIYRCRAGEKYQNANYITIGSIIIDAEKKYYFNSWKSLHKCIRFILPQGTINIL